MVEALFVGVWDWETKFPEAGGLLVLRNKKSISDVKMHINVHFCYLSERVTLFHMLR